MMDRRSWLWRRKSMEKSPGGETESSGGSASSNSERYSDDQGSRASPNHSSPNFAQSPEFSSNSINHEVQETVRSLTEKLSAALLDISAKEDLVKQHAKVAEDAVSGWEQAEAEVAALKQQLEATVEKNSVLQDRTNQLDEALKECVRQLHQSRDNQEEKTTCECESNRVELQKEIAELNSQLKDALSKSGSSNDHILQSKLEASEKENMALMIELVAKYKDIEVLSLERELSNQAAETASKQHLESIKKVGRLEAECRRLTLLANRFSSVTSHKPLSNSACIESLTDSHSDSGERFLTVDTELGCSDLWANALIAELDQFKHKDSARNRTNSVQIDLMDDFLEMERLVALPEADCSSSSFEAEADSDKEATKDGQSKVGNDVINHKLIQLEKKVQKLENEKAELENALANSNSRLEATHSQLNAADTRMLELQAQLDLDVEVKQAANESTTAEPMRNELESQLESALRKTEELHENVQTLEQKIEKEKAQSLELAARLDVTEAAKQTLEIELESAQLDANSLRRTLGLLESQLELGKALTSEIASELDASESARNVLESQLEDANSKIEKLYEKVSFLELRAEEAKIVSAETASKLVTVDAARQELEFKLSSAQMEVNRLNDKVDILERKIAEEKELSTELAVNCRKLETQLSKIKTEAELSQISNSNDEIRIKQEKELSAAAEKLAECQKTIASLGQQLKSLTNFDEFTLGAEKLEINGGLRDLKGVETKGHNQNGFSEKENGLTSSAMPALSPSKFSGFTRLLSRSRSASRVDTQ